MKMNARMSHAANLLAEQIAASINDNAKDLRALPNLSEVQRRLSNISDNINTILAKAKGSDEPTLRLHDRSLSLLGKALWHPIVFQFDRRRLRSVQKSANSLESNGQQLSGFLRQMESIYTQTASGNFLSVPKNSRSGQPTGSTEIADEPVEPAD